jgi:hypothetical protein
MKFLENLKQVDINALKLRTLLIINLYEYLIGTILGYLFNFFSIIILRFYPKENSFKTIFLSTITVVFFVSILDIIHESVKKLPGVYEYTEESWFVYPSPIALTFGFWATQNQLKLRNKQIRNLLIKLKPKEIQNYLSQIKI